MRERYKDSVLGRIPIDWEVHKLGKIANAFAGGTPKRGVKGYYNGTIPWIKSGEVNNNSIVSSEESVTELALLESSAKLIEPNSILVALYGATAGKVGVLKVAACSNQAVLAVTSKTKAISNYFLYHYLKKCTIELLNLCQGSGQPNLSKSIVESVQIPLPPLPEQQKIAEILSTVDDKIDVIDQQISETQALKKGLMQRLLSKGIGHTEFKDSPLGEIPKSWDEYKLGTIGDFLKGKGISKSELTIDGEYPCVRYGEIYTTYDTVVKSFKSFINQESANNSFQFNSGDLLFTGSGETVEDIGKCVTYIGAEEPYASGDIVILRPRLGNSKFLSYFMNSELIRTQTRKLGQGNSVVHIYAKHLAQLSLVLPSEKEQIQIVSILEGVDEKLEALQDKKTHYQVLKKGLMQQLLTGKIRVAV